MEVQVDLRVVGGLSEPTELKIRSSRISQAE